MREFDNLREANREIARLRDFIKNGYSLREVDFTKIVRELLALGIKASKIRDTAGFDLNSIRNLESGRTDSINPRHHTGEMLINYWAEVTGNCFYEAPKK